MLQNNPKLYMKNFVCFGGGNAMPKAVLSKLKKYPVRITSVTSMVDDGSSTGQLRKDFNILPPGDIRRHILALSDAPIWKKKLWDFKFGHEIFDGGHKGHNFANVFIGGLEYATKDYGIVLDAAHNFLEVKKHRALPATINKVQLAALLENGEEILGENEIDIPKKHNENLKIEKIYLMPEAKAYPPVLNCIKRADIIIIGPGDLYSSLLPCFLPKGISKAIKQSRAKKILICNIMTKRGETNNFSVFDFANETEKYIDCRLDFVIYNSQIPGAKKIKKAIKEEPYLEKLVAINKDLDKKKFIETKILEKTEPLVYNSIKLAKAIIKLT